VALHRAVLRLSLVKSHDDPSQDSFTIFALVLLSTGIVALHASTGSVIGFGASKGDIFPSLLQAIMYRTIYVLIILAFIMSTNKVVGSVFLLASLFYGVILYWRAYKTILPESVPDDVKRKRIREARRNRLREEGEK